MEERILYLIDGSSYIFRAYHAIRSLHTSKGFPTNAIYGFTSMIFRFLKDYNPRYVGVVLDSKGKTFRDNLYPLYKANRGEAPDDLKVQIPKILEIIDAFRIPRIQVEGYEADDVMGTLAKKMEAKGVSVVLVTGDKDFCQLVSDKITLLDTMRNTKTGIKEVIERFGVPPDKVTDILALSGDTTDNIPGIHGIGKKTALELIKSFGSLEELLKNKDKLPQKQRELIETGEENAILSKKLVTIKTDIPIDIEDIEIFKYEGFDKERLRKIFEELEFRSLLRELGNSPKETPSTLFPLDMNPVSYSNYNLVLSREDLEKVIEKIKNTKEVSIDLETSSHNPMLAEIIGIALSPIQHEAYYVPVAHKSRASNPFKQLDLGYVLERIKPIVEDEEIKKFGQNLKYEYIVFERYGIKLKGIYCDTMIAAHLIDSSRLNYSLDDLAKHYLGHKTITYREITDRSRLRFDEVELEKAKLYACEDADVAMILGKKLLHELEKLNLMDVYRNIEIKFIEVLAKMEINGVRIDPVLLKELSQEFQKQLERISREIFEDIGFRFNLNSPTQLREVLFDILKLPRKKLTKTGEASTDVEVLTELVKFHHIPQKILEYRGISKLKSTYVDALPKLINPKTGRIHTSFNQAGTSTGRLSSSEPNLQNIPVKTPEGKKIREAFIPEDGFLILSADYSQIELRLLAHFSEDKSLIDAFLAGSDIHTRTASEIFGISEDIVSPEMRRLSKTINFGIIYGISPFGLAKQLGTSNSIAKSYIEEYFKRYKRVREYIEASIKEAQKKGYVETILGRRRPIPELKLKDRTTRGFAERTAINTPIQGSAADIIKIAMIRIHDRLTKGFKSRMILQVHDELLFEVHKDELEEATSTIKREMEEAWTLRVPLQVDIGIGKNWAEAH